MKNTPKPFLLISSLLGLFVVSCGDNFSDPKDAGSLCVYAGIRYTAGQKWTAKDGCNVCTCGFESNVLCSSGQICTDGGTSDVPRVTDAMPKSDGLSSDADDGNDASSIDVPVSSDTKVIDAAADINGGDGRG